MRTSAAVAAALVLLAVAGCGGSSSSSGGAAGGGSSGSQSAYLQQVKARVDRYLSPTGTYSPPPKTAPHPQPGKRIFLISCGQATTACAAAIGGAQQAATSVGWSSTIVDSKGDPSVAGAGIRRAVAEKADGIFVYYLDCQYLQAPLQEAKQAGIPVVAAESADCNQTAPGAPSLFTSVVDYEGGKALFPFIEEWMSSQVEYAIVRGDGKAHMLVVSDNTGSISRAGAAAGARTGAACKACTYKQLLVPYGDIGTTLQGRVEQTLLVNPNLTAVLSGYEAVLVGGLEAAVRGSGKHLLLSVGEGGPAGVQLLRAGSAQFGAGTPPKWEGFAAIDGLIRAMAGQRAQPSGIGVQLFDKDHNLPTGSRYAPPYDFVKLYEKAWGVGS